MKPDEWLEEAIHFYRQLGFFERHRTLTGPSLVQLLLSGEGDHVTSLKELLDRDRAPPSFQNHSRLLLLDEDRVWFQDAECVHDRRQYVRTLEAWSRISRGVFLPKAVKEAWAGAEGPVRVRFQWDGAARSFEAEERGEWLDLDSLQNGINPLLDPLGYAFESVETGTQEAFVVLLTPREKRILGEARGWPFCGG